MRPVAGDLPKELLPVAGKPVLQWTLEEAAAAGIERAVIVTSPGKPGIAEFLSNLPTVQLSISLVVQPRPRGLGDAIVRARAASGDGAIAVLLPDNLFTTREPAIAPVLAAHQRTGLPCVLLAELRGSDVTTMGATARVHGRARTDGLWDVLAVTDKGGTDRSPLTPIGRMVFDPGVFDRLERVRARLAPDAELDDVPLLQELAIERRLVGVPLAGVFFDVGVPDGYREALAALT
jgi:UTP--glucose-1-phosphate uridylyltransferase